MNLRQAGIPLLDVLFPKRCVQCRQRGSWICDGCDAAVHRLAAPLCDLCGREIGAGSRCQSCARDQPRIDGIRAATRYEHAVREAIHRLKYSGQVALAEPLAAYLELAASGEDPSVIAPVPLHPKRLQARGYNQSELLARQLGQRLGRPVAGLLARVRETEDQIGLKRNERQANVKGAFDCPSPEDVRGQSVLLVDDVCTTGSTLFACADSLYRAKAASVRAVVVARQDAGRE